MNSQHLTENPFTELLHGVASVNIKTPKQSPATTPSKSTPKQRSPLRPEAPSFVPRDEQQSPIRPIAQTQHRPHLQYQHQPQLHHRSQSQPHTRYQPFTPPKHHPYRHPLPLVPRVTVSRREICTFFGMDNMIDDLYEDVVQFLGERPPGKSEVEALEFYLEFVASGGEVHKGERPCRYCAWFGNGVGDCEYLGLGIWACGVGGRRL
ncbi:hypothetical protein BKA64DRAFT_713964 [Cadophora sp. MPI-SDFR-AT-0126]|nr:hypothetical protein BKA64DRAFT_713964 [Leotiomycetes sp. MPI-SDFR-AT-0126]